MTTRLEFLNVRYRHSHNFELSVTHTFQEGNITCILGPSGSGKSTVLRLASGLIRPDSGQVTIGVSRHECPSPFSMVFQDYALYPHLTVEENAVLAFQCSRTLRDNRKYLVASLAPRLGIEHILNRKPAQISGGERQRAAILKVLTSDAPVWLLDEPFSNLDAWNRHQLRSIILEVQRSKNSTVLWVTHDSWDALSAARDVLVLRDGNLIQSGTVLSLLKEPKTIDVARALRTPPFNEFRGALSVGIEAVEIRLGIAELACTIPKHLVRLDPTPISRDALFMLDPELIKISPHPVIRDLHFSIPGQLALVNWSPNSRCLVECTTPIGRISAYCDYELLNSLTLGAALFLLLPVASFEHYNPVTGVKCTTSLINT